jgi:hypothetical protein
MMRGKPLHANSWIRIKHGRIKIKSYKIETLGGVDGIAKLKNIKGFLLRVPIAICLLNWRYKQIFFVIAA